MALNPPGQKRPRIPLEVDGIQVNCCKNPICQNFGVKPKSSVPRGGVPEKRPSGDTYIVVAHGKGKPALKCLCCGEIFPMKSNLAVAEELKRIEAPLGITEPTCQNQLCANHSVGVSAGSPHYKAFGHTKSGSQRYQCLSCRKTFAIGKPTKRQRKTHKNIDVFDRLVGKQPFARICDSLDITMSTLYGKIDFLHRQCTAFAAHREKRGLAEGPVRDRLYVGVDRQVYVSNWTERSDRRNIQLFALGSGDLRSGYIFGMHLNYVSDLDSSSVEQEAIQSGDYNSPAPFRRYARLWLKKDYVEAVANSKAPPKTSNSLRQKILETYMDAAGREDVEAPDLPQGTNRKLPKQGMQVHSEYTLYGHFHYLAKLFGKVEKVRFFMDQESGIRAAMMSAFTDRIRSREVDGFYVRLQKHHAVWEKQQTLAASRKRFAKEQLLHPDLSPHQVELEMVKAEMAKSVSLGKWSDRWITHPFPNMSEPEKAVCYLTDYGDYTDDHLAQMYLMATLQPIDRFFMQVRRRLSLLERPIDSASAGGRVWYGYSAYNPAVIEKVLEIFRVYYNYVFKGNDKETTAMRLGLAKGPVTMEDIIRFDPNERLRNRTETKHKANQVPVETC